MSYFFRIFWVSLFVKLVISYFLPLLPDEAYYWIWSHHLQLSYYDHPPMIAWLFAIGHWLEPFGQAIRFPAVILLHLSLLVWRRIFIELELSEPALNRFVLLILFIPYLGFGSLILTPDLPLMLFWPLCLFFFIRVTKRENRIDYILLGTSLGLGFLSKYHIVLFLLCAIVYLTFEKKWNVIRWRFIGWTFLSGLVFSLPVIIWNFNNDFQSFAFQLKHGLEAKQWNWHWPVEYFFGQLFMLLPPFFYYFIKKRNFKPLKIFFYFTSTILVFFFFTSFKSSVEMNWTLMAFPVYFAFIAAAEIPKKWMNSTLLFLFLFNISLIGAMFSGIYPHGKIFEPFFFLSQKSVVQKYKPLYGINYQISSSLWYFSKIPVFKLNGASRFDFFDTLTKPILSEKIIYVFKEFRNEYPQWVLDLKPKSEIAEKLDREYVIERLEFE